jgi:hypothetical protein
MNPSCGGAVARPGLVRFVGKSARIRRKTTAQFFGLVRRDWKNVALPVMPGRTFHRPLGFFLLIMITLGAKTINACAVFGFPSTLYPGFKVKVTHLPTQGGTDKTLVDVRQHLSRKNSNRDRHRHLDSPQ